MSYVSSTVLEKNPGESAVRVLLRLLVYDSTRTKYTQCRHC